MDTESMNHMEKVANRRLDAVQNFLNAYKDGWAKGYSPVTVLTFIADVLVVPEDQLDMEETE